VPQHDAAAKVTMIACLSERRGLEGHWNLCIWLGTCSRAQAHLVSVSFKLPGHQDKQGARHGSGIQWHVLQ